MRILVERCTDMARGRVAWLEGTAELLFVVSAESVTDVGAAALADGWQAWVDARLWYWGPPRPGALPILDVVYELGDAGGDAVVLSFANSRVSAVLSPEHFDAGTAASLERVGLEVAMAGWTWVPRVRAVVSEG